MLDALEHLLLEREQDVVDALRADLGKPEAESVGAGDPFEQVSVERYEIGSGGPRFVHVFERR